MQFRAITIAGEVGSGKSALAVALLPLLPGWTRVNTGQRFRDFCESKGLSIQQVSTLPDSVHREFDNLQLEMLRTGHQMIVEGRLSGWLARDLPDVFRLFCCAPIEVRVQRYLQRDHVDPATAYEDVAFRDREDVEKFRKIYGVSDYRDADFYHLRLDTSCAAPPELARQVIKAAGLVQA